MRRRRPPTRAGPFTQEEMGRRILEIYRKVLDAPPCNPTGIAPPKPAEKLPETTTPPRELP